MSPSSFAITLSGSLPNRRLKPSRPPHKWRGLSLNNPSWWLSKPRHQSRTTSGIGSHHVIVYSPDHYHGPTFGGKDIVTFLLVIGWMTRVLGYTLHLHRDEDSLYWNLTTKMWGYVPIWFQGLLSFPSKCFSAFPYGTFALSVSPSYI